MSKEITLHKICEGTIYDSYDAIHRIIAVEMLVSAGLITRCYRVKKYTFIGARYQDYETLEAIPTGTTPDNIEIVFSGT